MKKWKLRDQDDYYISRRHTGRDYRLKALKIKQQLRRYAA
jgi:hypothetical protein